MLCEPPIEDFLAGGYLLARPYAPPDDRHAGFFPPDLVTPPVITASPCIATLMPDGLLFGWPSPRPEREDLHEAAADWGTEPARRDALLAWADAAVRDERVRAGDAFADLESARECLRLFGPADQGVRVLGLGLRRADRADFFAALERESAELSARLGTTVNGDNGLVEGLKLDLPLAGGGRVLGYEVLDVALCESRHSWLCHGLEREMHRRFDLHLLPGGLIPAFAKAQQVAACCDDATVGCEPGVWRAWVVVEYDALG